MCLRSGSGRSVACTSDIGPRPSERDRRGRLHDPLRSCRDADFDVVPAATECRSDLHSVGRMELHDTVRTYLEPSEHFVGGRTEREQIGRRARHDVTFALNPRGGSPARRSRRNRRRGRRVPRRGKRASVRSASSTGSVGRSPSTANGSRRRGRPMRLASSNDQARAIFHRLGALPWLARLNEAAPVG
jgi:hypothetical protein